jgi:hypothetical protein
MNEEFANFLHLHYLTKRKDSEFWKTFKNKNKTPKYITSIKQFKLLSERDLEYLNAVYAPNSTSEHIETFGIQSWKTVTDGIKFYDN